jgi:hypothetical protein
MKVHILFGVPSEPTSLQALADRLRADASPSHADLVQAVVILFDALVEDQRWRAKTLREAIRGTQKDLEGMKQQLAELELEMHAEEQPSRVHG